MGTEAAIAATMAMQAGAGIYSGMQQKQAADVQADIYDQQANIIREDTALEAERRRRQFRRLNAIQKLQYLHQGVTMSGSPDSMLAGSINEQNREISSLMNAGMTRAYMLNYQGKAARASGRNALVGGIMSGISSAAGTYATAKSGGYFNSSNEGSNGG